jgi:glycosyltransferase involved in cell wall biosynthesis
VRLLFVHKNFPAQFGHIARHLIQSRGWQCFFVSETSPGESEGIKKIQYQVKGGATRQTHYCSRSFENAVWHASAVHEAVKNLAAEIQPDLVIGHSGFGSTLYLPELFPSAPIINYFEYFYHPHNSDLDFRQEWQTPEIKFLRSRTRNGMILLDLENCRAGYCPTEFQRSLFPKAYAPKLRVLHDGIETSLWKPDRQAERRFRDFTFAPSTRVVTYVSRGFESMRGFDIFMRVAKRIYQEHPDVVFLAPGSKKVSYGGDLEYIKEPTFFDHALKQEEYDLRRFIFPGRVPPAELAQILNLSDLHIYLTVPFVLSWSLLNAMACGCAILASDTAPVREVIQHNRNGLLADFFNVEGLARQALEVLKEPGAWAPLRAAAAETIQQNYSLEKILPRMEQFFLEVAGGR